MDQPILHLDDGESAIFAYGSLLSPASLERTLKKKYAKPLVICSVPGWQRSWDVIMPNRTFYTRLDSERMYPENIIYLNVRPQIGGLLNGVLIVVSGDELKSIDEREWIYDRRVVTDQLQGVVVKGGDAFIYVAKQEWIMKNVPSTRVASVRSTYLDIVEDGLNKLGSSFRNAYEGSTDPVPEHLVIQDQRDD